MIKELRNREDELDCEIIIIVRTDNWGANNENWGIQIDNKITPIYCCNCKKQLEHLYKLEGSRYGQVGTVNCICGANIHCVDSDNIVEYLETYTTVNDNTVGEFYIDFVKLFRLENSSFLKIKDNFGYNIFEKYANQKVNLKDVIDELESMYLVNIKEPKDYSSDVFKRLPLIVNKWFELLNMTKE